MSFWNAFHLVCVFTYYGIFIVTWAQGQDALHSFESESTKSTLMESELLPEATESATRQWDCMTPEGAPGICKKLYECYRMFVIRNNLDINSTLEDPLYEETLNNLKSDECSEDSFPRVCCSTNGREDETSTPGGEPVDSEYLHDDDSIIIEQIGSKDKVHFDSPIVRDTSFGNAVCGNTYRNTRVLNSSEEERDAKITGGKFAKKGQFPWMVAIFGKNKKQLCGGSLINNEYVLTASHCLFSQKSQDLEHLSLNIGDYNIRSSTDGQHETRKIAKIILHKQFNIQNYHNDVALLKLDEPVIFSQWIQPICLPSANLDLGSVEGTEVTVMGWGVDRPWGRPSDVLKYVEMPMWKLSECKKVYGSFAPNRLQSWNLCAGDGKRNKDACIGDSGGPLVKIMNSKFTQLGIVSWGKGCGSFPGVYTSTQSFLKWIEKHMTDQ